MVSSLPLHTLLFLIVGWASLCPRVCVYLLLSCNACEPGASPSLRLLHNLPQVFRSRGR